MRQWTVARSVEYEVVVVHPVREVVACVVDGVGRADRSDQVRLRRAAHAGDFRSERLGQLHRKCSHASRLADDQDLLPRLSRSHVAKTLEGGDSGGGHGRSLLKGKVCRLRRKPVLSSTGVLGKGAVAGAEHLITRLERVTFSPTAATCPATSVPRTCTLGARSP